MPNTNQFAPWATAAGADVLSNAAYLALASRLAGFGIGITSPTEMNSVLRQASFVAAAIGQFAADYGSGNVNDDGIVANFETNFISALGGAFAVSAPSYLVRFHGGLTISNDVTLPNTVIDIAVGAATSDDFSTMMQLKTAFTKSISAFVVGSGNGGLDTGSAIASRWYHVHLIQGSAGTDVLLSLSPTTPSMPTGFTKHRRIGSVFLDGSVHITPFLNVGDWFFFLATRLDVNGVAQSASAGSKVVSIPLGVTCMWRGIVSNSAGAAGHSVWAYSPMLTDEAASATEATIKSTSTDTVMSQIDVLSDAASNIRIVCDGTTGTYSIRTLGWCELGRA
jgi:hypothetical protein